MKEKHKNRNHTNLSKARNTKKETKQGVVKEKHINYKVKWQIKTQTKIDFLIVNSLWYLS